MSPDQIAQVCHETNRAYCQATGDHSQPTWDQAPGWQRASAIKGVQFHLAHPGSAPSRSHEEWLKEKTATGWKFGPVKDPEKKEHPCFVPYDELPAAQKVKDSLFIAVVDALRPMADPLMLAEHLYTSYCAAVGGKAHNGDPLPDWKTFYADPTKQKQSTAWIETAKALRSFHQ